MTTPAWARPAVECYRPGKNFFEWSAIRVLTTTGNGCLNQRVQFFVTTDSELKMAGGDTLHFQILGSIAGQLEHFSGQVLQDSGGVDSGGSANTTMRSGAVFQVAMNTSNGELSKVGRAKNCRISLPIDENFNLNLPVIQPWRSERPPLLSLSQNLYQLFHQPIGL